MSKGTNVCKGTLEWKHAHADSRERVLKSNRVVAPIPAAHVYKYAETELPAVGPLGVDALKANTRIHVYRCPTVTEIVDPWGDGWFQNVPFARGYLPLMRDFGLLLVDTEYEQPCARLHEDLYAVTSAVTWKCLAHPDCDEYCELCLTACETGVDTDAVDRVAGHLFDVHGVNPALYIYPGLYSE